MASTTFTLRIPLRMKQRGYRRPVQEDHRPCVSPDPVLVALARAWQWQQWMREGRYSTVTHLAAAVGFEASYVARLLRLSLLAPWIVEAIVHGEPSDRPTLRELEERLPLDWRDQWQRFDLGHGPTPHASA